MVQSRELEVPDRTLVTPGPPGGLVLLLAVACGLTVANLYYAQPLLAGLRLSFGISDVAAGGLITATQVGYALGLVFLVPLGDRIENRRLVSILLAVTAIGLVAVGAAPNFLILAVAAVVSGSTSVVVQILIPFAAGLAPDRTRGRIVGRVVSGLLVGVLLSRTVGSLVAQMTSWRVVYLASALCMATLAAALRVVLPRRAVSTDVPYGLLLASTARMVRIHPALRRRALYQASMFAAFTAFWTTISYVLAGPPFHYSQFGIGLFALIGAGGVLVAPLAGRWADQGLGRRMTAVAFAAAALAFAMAGFGRHSIVLLATAGVVIDAAVQANFIFGQHTIYGLDSSARARLNSVYLATFFLGGAIGSQLGSIVYHFGGWAAVAALGAALPVLALLGWATEHPAPRATPPAPVPGDAS